MHCKKNCALNSVKTDLNHKFSRFSTEKGWRFQSVWATENARRHERRQKSTGFQLGPGQVRGFQNLRGWFSLRQGPKTACGFPEGFFPLVTMCHAYKSVSSTATRNKRVPLQPQRQNTLPKRSGGRARCDPGAKQRAAMQLLISRSPCATQS